MKGKTKAVSLPIELYRQIEQRIDATEFRSVDDYVVFVLEEVVKEEPAAGFSEQDEAEVRKRLKNLGYLD